jgi:hypothetical protein
MRIEGLPNLILQKMVEYAGGQAWEYPVVLDVLDWLLLARIAVLGGDVLEDGPSGPRYTGANWYLNPEPGMLWGAYVDRSNEHAREYICAYPKNSAVKYLFSLVCTDKLPTRP